MRCVPPSSCIDSPAHIDCTADHNGQLFRTFLVASFRCTRAPMLSETNPDRRIETGHKAMAGDRSSVLWLHVLRVQIISEERVQLNKRRLIRNIKLILDEYRNCCGRNERAVDGGVQIHSGSSSGICGLGNSRLSLEWVGQKQAGCFN